jgi:hypothetical protein
MAQGGLKAATTVVGPFEKGIVDRCLTRVTTPTNKFAGIYDLSTEGM